MNGLPVGFFSLHDILISPETNHTISHTGYFFIFSLSLIHNQIGYYDNPQTVACAKYTVGKTHPRLVFLQMLGFGFLAIPFIISFNSSSLNDIEKNKSYQKHAPLVKDLAKSDL